MPTQNCPLRKRSTFSAAVAAALLSVATITPTSDVLATAPVNSKVRAIALNPIGTYETGLIDESAAEIVAFDKRTKRLFITNANDQSIDVIDIRRPRNPVKAFSISVAEYGNPNSVAVHRGLIAIAVADADKTKPGRVVFYNQSGELLNKLSVGALPDMLTFTPDGQKLLVANEGEPNDNYDIDPEGSISVINVNKRISLLTQDDVSTIGFNQFNSSNTPAGVRVFGPGASVAQDLEPEYITVSEDSTTAWVALQENNALAKIDLTRNQVTALLPLGTKSYMCTSNAIDASDKDGDINLKTWPVVGMYQPDPISSYTVDGATYVVTANEGDARDYDGFSEEFRVGDDEIVLDPALLTKYPGLTLDENLGRLKTTSVDGDLDGDGDIDQIHSYGARSFSIWDENGNLLFDSGSDFARITADVSPELFNGGDKRSDDKGAEPEGITIGKAYGRTFAFIGLERTSGIMVYDITNPRAPRFVQYINNQRVEGDVDEGTAGDVSPEGLLFIPRGQSPINKPLLVVTNEVSGSTTLYAVNRVR